MLEFFDANSYVTTKEKIYFGLMLLFSILFYLIIFITIIGAIYVVFIALLLFFMQGIAIGHIKQNSVKITAKQFGDIYNKVVKYSQKLKIRKVPDVYLMESGGLLNAFATSFLSKDIIVIYSDVMELAYEQGEDAVDFIIAHELAHIKRKHLSKKKYIVLGGLIPFLGLAYSRACESTCDRIASELVEGSNIEGLIVLTSGKKLYKQVDVTSFLINTDKDKDIWSWFAEIFSTHPHLSTRIKYLKDVKDKFVI